MLGCGPDLRGAEHAPGGGPADRAAGEGRGGSDGAIGDGAGRHHPANFKSFADEAEMPLGRITCIIGPNGPCKPNAIYCLEKTGAVLSGENYRREPGT